MGSERKDQLTRYHSPHERRAHRRARRRIGALLLAVFMLLTLLDVPIAHLLFNENRDPIQQSDFDRIFRVLGSLWVWFLLMWIIRRHDRVWDRAGSLFFAPIIAGLCAEGLKLVIARERPTIDPETLRSGWYTFRPLFSGFADATNLGFPSSHTAVAFAGCMCLAAWMPRAKWIFILLATGCGIGRMLIGAHYATDVYVGALIGWGWARFFEPVEKPVRYA